MALLFLKDYHMIFDGLCAAMDRRRVVVISVSHLVEACGRKKELLVEILKSLDCAAPYAPSLQ